MLNETKITAENTGNVERDLKNHQLLKEQGWKVIIVWECELKKNMFGETIGKLIAELKAMICQENIPRQL